MAKDRTNRTRRPEPPAAQPVTEHIPATSPSDHLLYQTAPAMSKPSLYRPSGWTDTVAGYVREAKQLTQCILQNERLAGEPYSWFVTVNVDDEQPAAEVNALWRRVSRRLKAGGIVALWVREVGSNNKIHYHMLVRSRIGRAALGDAVHAAMKPEAARWHWRPQQVRAGGVWQLAHYMTKAKISGFVNGRRVDDYYADKRLLFRSKTGVRKLGQIGGFWVESRAAIWRGIRDREERIADGLERPHVRPLVDHMYALCDGTVPVAKIERAVGYYAADPDVQAWAERVVGGDGYWSAGGGPSAGSAPGRPAGSPTTGTDRSGRRRGHKFAWRPADFRVETPREPAPPPASMVLATASAGRVRPPPWTTCRRTGRAI